MTKLLADLLDTLSLTLSITMTLYFSFLQHWLLLLWHVVSELRNLRAQKPVFRRSARCKPEHHYRPAKPRRSGGRPKPAYVREEVLALHAASGSSHRLIATQFNRLHAAADGMTVGASTVRLWLRKYASEMTAVKSATRNRIPRDQSPNHCWGMDMTGRGDESGHQHLILGIIDHGTRRSLCLKRLADKTSATLLRQVLLAVEQYGKPARIKTDNEAVFRCPVFSNGLAKAGIRHEFSAPGKPWQNGRIERLFLTLKEKLRLVALRDGAELDQLLSDFRYWYNDVRPHQHLHGHTPNEVWLGINPYACRPRAVTQYVGGGGLLTGLALRYR